MIGESGQTPKPTPVPIISLAFNSQRLICGIVNETNTFRNASQRAGHVAGKLDARRAC